MAFTVINKVLAVFVLIFEYMLLAFMLLFAGVYALYDGLAHGRWQQNVYSGVGEEVRESWDDFVQIMRS